MENGHLKKTIQEQAVAAAKLVDSMFIDDTIPIPEDATLEMLWAEVCRLRKKIKHPRKSEAIKLILENPELTGLSIPLIADIVRQIFQRHGFSCDTSESSIRWYISQKTLEWNIQPRKKNLPEKIAF